MSLGSIVLSGLAVLLFAAGPGWYFYLIYRFLIAHCARVAYREKPAAHFVLSNVIGYIWLFVPPLLHSTISANWESPTSFFAFWMDILLSMLGMLGWAVLGIKRFDRLARPRIFAATYPRPKYQIWLQDILSGLFALGLSMAVILSFVQYLKEPGLPVVLAIYEVITQFVMFFAVLDACRFSERLKSPKLRAIYVFSIMFMNAFVPLPVLTALAWNVWRRGMFLTQEALEARQMQAAVQVEKPAVQMSSGV